MSEEEEEEDIDLFLSQEAEGYYIHGYQDLISYPLIFKPINIKDDNTGLLDYWSNRLEIFKKSRSKYWIQKLNSRGYSHNKIIDENTVYTNPGHYSKITFTLSPCGHYLLEQYNWSGDMCCGINRQIYDLTNFEALIHSHSKINLQTLMNEEKSGKTAERTLIRDKATEADSAESSPRLISNIDYIGREFSVGCHDVYGPEDDYPDNHYGSVQVNCGWKPIEVFNTKQEKQMVCNSVILAWQKRDSDDEVGQMFQYNFPLYAANYPVLQGLMTSLKELRIPSDLIEIVWRYADSGY